MGPRNQGTIQFFTSYHQTWPMLDSTSWRQWFLETLLNSLEQALARIGRVLVKARFWQAHRRQTLSAEQVKVLNHLLDGGERGFENGISAAQYQAVAKVSKATATRHLSDLPEKGCIERPPGGGRSTRYHSTPSTRVGLISHCCVIAP